LFSGGKKSGRFPDKYRMRLYEIIYATLEEAEAVVPEKPLTPAQMSKRNERARRTQQRIADERARSAAKVRDLRADLP
jgi:hypothetical protein